ncbi:hypothetical protein M514_27678 [Trichuris suis]|uniref:Integrase core domain protein n=1 Tax=Trichuris suis TaxID=68888 RepID=A0A085MSF4_9BILA|nr:hypothetical protein M514_27678 [Trichuris suis]
MYWKTKVKAMLVRDDLWDIVSAPKPEVRTTAWMKQNNKAMALITLSVEDGQLLHIANCDTAFDMWEKLRKQHARSSFGSQLYLRRKLYSIRFTSGSMQDHINSMLEVVELLKGTGTEISDGELVAVLLCSLPESYSGLITALEGRDESELSVDYVTGKMLDEYQRRVESCGSTDDDGTALRMSSAKSNRPRQWKGDRPNNKERRKCFFCKRPGHLKADCEAFKKTKAAEVSVGDKTGFAAAKHVSFTLCKRAYESCSAHWLVDSGASSRMTSEKTFFKSLRPYKQQIYLANGASVYTAGIGDGWLQCRLPNGRMQQVQLKNVLYVPVIQGNLLSVRQIVQHGFRVIFEDTACTVSRRSRVVAYAVRHGSLYELDCVAAEDSARVATSATCLHRWHRRLGHRDLSGIKRLLSEGLATGIDVKMCGKSVICESCVKGKITQKRFQKGMRRSVRPLDLVHSDLCGPMPTITPSGNRYMLTLIDDYSRFTVVRLLRSKDEVTGAIMEYVAKMKNRFGRKPIAFRTDNGGEYAGQQLKKYFREEGIEHQTTIPYTPQQNGVAERKNRSLTEMAKCMLLDAGLHNRFWGEAVRTAAYLQNRLPSRSVDRTPFEHFLGRKPELGHIRVFGSKVFCLVPKQRRRKWDDKAVEGVLIGYDDATKGYRILDPKTNRTWVSCSVKIVEKAGVEKCIAAPEPEGELERELMTSQPKEGVLANLDRPEEERLPTAASNQVSNVEEDRNLSEDEGLILPATKTLIRRSHRANKGIPPKKLCYRVQVPRKMEPSSWDEMLSLSPEEKEKWMSAAEEEMKSLKDYKVWELVDLPQGKKPISCKWVFKAKLDSQGRVQTYKARLVARGFSQKYGEDYDETFAPVVKHDTIRVLFAVAAARGLHVRHLDVKCAYLNGKLEEELYMEQPQGFVEAGKESKVLLLKKSIYGLRQSARCWNRKATEALSQLGFVPSQADQCLFTRKEKDGESTYVLLYVDDLLVAGSSEKLTRKVGEQVNAHFQTKDLGGVVHYLGIEVKREEDGSFLLCQKGKIAEMLKEHGMLEPKPATTPMETGYLNSLLDKSKTLPNNKRYRQAIGSLLYLATVSRPDIAMAWERNGAAMLC